MREGSGPKGPDIDCGQRASGSTSRRKGLPHHRDRSYRKGPIMSTMRHLASPIAKSFSEALRIDTGAGS